MRPGSRGPGHAGKLAVLLDALAGIPISDADRASLTWLAGFETSTVENLAVVITRARSIPRSTDKIGHRAV